MIQDGRGGVNQIENRAAPCYDNHTATKAPSFGVPRLRCGVAVGVVPGGLSLCILYTFDSSRGADRVRIICRRLCNYDKTTAGKYARRLCPFCR